MQMMIMVADKSLCQSLTASPAEAVARWTISPAAVACKA